jgi:hypothetical protein
LVYANEEIWIESKREEVVVLRKENNL